MGCVRERRMGEHAVEYDTRSHLSVLLQLYGSVWQSVIPYCIFNVGLMLYAHYHLGPIFKARGIEVTGKGHTISTFFVSFLVVTRSNMALNRYITALNNIRSMFGNARNFFTNIVCHTKNDQSESAKKWRNEIAYYTLLLVRLSMAAFNYGEEKIAAWKSCQLKGKIKDQILKANQFTGETKQWAHTARTEAEENYRVPNIMALHLRMALYDHEANLNRPIEPPMMGRFNGLLDSVMNSYNAQVKMITTPMPFPLVQMARTMMFVWVFTLPLAINSDESAIVVHCVVVFLLTFAFMGIETVSMELDDPFGQDENDLDNNGLASYFYEDIYNVVSTVDGAAIATQLSEIMRESKECLPATEDMALLA